MLGAAQAEGSGRDATTGCRSSLKQSPIICAAVEHDYREAQTSIVHSMAGDVYVLSQQMIRSSLRSATNQRYV
jgi:hypothetical protein